MPIAILNFANPQIFHSSWINLTINFATVFWLFPKHLQCLSSVNPYDFFCLSKHIPKTFCLPTFTNQWHVPHLRIPEPPQANRMPIAFGKPWFQGPMGWPLKMWVEINGIDHLLDFCQEEQAKPAIQNSIWRIRKFWDCWKEMSGGTYGGKD